MKRNVVRRSSLPVLVVIGAVVLPASVAAQPAPPPPPVAPPPAIAPRAPAVDTLAIALAPRPGGLTPAEVGKTASRTKYSVRAKQAELQAAAARVDQALVSYFPRITVAATYTRLSEVVSGSLGAGGIVGAANLGPLKVDATGAVVDSKGQPVGAAAFSFPSPPLNSYSFVAALSVPVSDYLLRLSQGYASASRAEKSKRFEAEAEALQAAADAKIAYFNWVRAKGQLVVAKEAVEQAKAHVDDANKAFAVGLISKTDVLRLDAQVAAAQQLEAEAGSFVAIAAEQLRVTLHLPPDRAMEIGSDVMHEPVVAPAETLAQLQDQGLQRRLEIRALDETILSLKEVESVARAGYFPRIDAFADAVYANPNQRFVPAQNRFDFSWDAGVRLSWTLNDTFSTIGSAAEAKARVATVTEQKGSLRDGVRIEVASAYADVMKAAPTIEAAERGVVASEENLRVRRELFKQGKTTSLDLVDSETELTRARLRRLDARVGMLVAKTRLEHATGRDVPARPPGQ